MVELQVPIAIAAKYAILTVTRLLLYAHQSPFRKMEMQMSPKAVTSTAQAAGHTWLRCPPWLQQWLPTHQPSAGKPEALECAETETLSPHHPTTAVFCLSFESWHVPFSEQVTEDVIQHFLKLKCWRSVRPDHLFPWVLQMWAKQPPGLKTG